MTIDYNDFALRFWREMRSIKAVEDCQTVLEEYLKELGISVYAFTYYAYHPNSVNKLKYNCAASINLVWHRHYIERGYDKIDSTLASNNRSNMPVAWTIEQQLREAKSDLERKMREDSQAYGVERGISVPVHGFNGDFAELMVQQHRGQHCLRDSKHLQFVIMHIAHIYYDCLRKLLLKHCDQDNKYQLTKRETQCLKLIMENYAVADMAEALNITERTINFHIQRINRKLGTKNKYQSAAKAMKEGLIVL